MLHPMQQPSPTSPSFAGLLAALAAHAQSPGDRSSSPGWQSSHAWNDDGLADDVATLSYESALRAHARYRPTDQSLTQPAYPQPFSFEETSSAASAAAPPPVPHSAANPHPTANPEREPNRLRPTPFQRNLKDASITIRMSQAECAQLHRRAAEAGLTVSAYLRSCTFEAESLRAMVKDTLLQLRSVPTPPKPARSAPPRRSRFSKLTRWLAGLITPWHGSPRIARA
jgi:hypothetical protein